MKSIFTVLTILSICFTAFAQTGTVKGVLNDVEANDVVIGGTVVAKGTPKGVATDISGQYSLSLEPGTYTLVASYIGLLDVEKQVTIVADQTVTVNFDLQEDAEMLEGVTIEAETEYETQAVLVLQRQKATTILQNIGSQELSAKGLNTVEAGLTKIAGTSKVSGGGIFVRGLGDRYNNVYMNGLPIPSPNPDRKVVTLDLFPTSLVESIDIEKVYNPYMYGDMSGASINIRSKKPRDYRILEFSVSANYNTQTTFKDFKVRRTGFDRFIGRAGDDLNTPFDVKSREDATFPLLGTDNAGPDPFNGSYSQNTITAPVDTRFKLLYGDGFSVGSEGTLGFLYSGNFSNSYRFDEGVYDLLGADLNPIQGARERRRYSYTANFTNLGSIRYDINKQHRIDLNYIGINQGYDQFFELPQEAGFDREIPSQQFRTRFIQRSVNTFQLLGEHETLNDKITFDWGASYSDAVSDEPDRIDYTFNFAEFGATAGRLNIQNLQRYFQLVEEDELAARAEFTFNLGESIVEGNSSRVSLHVGGNYRDKTRDVYYRNYFANFDRSAGFGRLEIPFDSLDQYIFTDENYGQSYTYGEFTRNQRLTSIERTIAAGYTYANIQVNDKLLLTPGVRVEKTDQEIAFRTVNDPLDGPARISTVNETDVLPSLSAKYKFHEKHDIRLAGSKTLSRPNLRELLPFPYIDERNLQTVGNPNLIDSEIYNGEIQYSYFPSPGELLSVSVFYKNIDNPVERFRLNNFVEFYNVNEADAIGVELEFNKNIGKTFSSYNNFLNGLSLDGNLTLMRTSIDVNPQDLQDSVARDRLSLITSTDRKLQGASPFLLNVSLGYEGNLFSDNIASNIKLTYATFGDRIINVGVNGIGDELQEGYGSLDLIIQNSFGDKFSTKLSFRNLLNPAINQYQEGATGATTEQTALTQSYVQGVNIGFSMTYKPWN